MTNLKIINPARKNYKKGKFKSPKKVFKKIKFKKPEKIEFPKKEKIRLELKKIKFPKLKKEGERTMKRKEKKEKKIVGKHKIKRHNPSRKKDEIKSILTDGVSVVGGYVGQSFIASLMPSIPLVASQPKQTQAMINFVPAVGIPLALKFLLEAFGIKAKQADKIAIFTGVGMVSNATLSAISTFSAPVSKQLNGGVGSIKTSLPTSNNSYGLAGTGVENKNIKSYIS
jgi:hypothetical protein